MEKARQRDEFGTTKVTSVPTNKNIAAGIVSHISSALREPGVIFENLFYLVVPNWLMQTLQVM